MSIHDHEDEAQHQIGEELLLLQDELEHGRNRIYEKYGSAGTSILEVTIRLCEAARMDRPDEVLAFLRESANSNGLAVPPRVR